MSSSIDIYPIKSHVKEILKLHGLNTDLDVLSYSKDDLLKVTPLQANEIDSVLDILNDSNPMCIYTANVLTLLEQIALKIPIPSLSNCLDNMLDGGFHTGRMYQLYGESGSGKTQLCLQLCCTVQMPKLVGGNQSCAFYIDTENTFKSERFIEIAMATIERVEQLADTQEQNLTIKKMIENLFVFKCQEPQELSALIIHHLEQQIIDKQPKLIILDSIAYQFRYGYDEFVHFKRKILIQLAQKLKYLAFKYDLCVVCVNQISFDLKNQKIVPSLGCYWNTTPFANIRFSRVLANIRSIQGEKGCYKKERVYFKIEKDGIRDLDDLSDLDELKLKLNENEKGLGIMFTQEAQLLNDSFN